jgi:hypothetical protein
MPTVPCPECEGSGLIERVNWNGPYLEPCSYCYMSLGEVDIDDEEEDD